MICIRMNTIIKTAMIKKHIYKMFDASGFNTFFTENILKN